jgi:hemerythrin-like domain-containing protein
MHQFYEQLKKDHKEVKGLLKKLKDSSGEKQREDLFSQLKMEIKPHLKAEEKAFYPALTKEKDSKEDALESIEEHHVTELVMNELEKLGKSEDRWLAKMKVFAELVEHHIEEEEGKLFKVSQKVLKDDQMSDIMEKFEKEKEQVKSKL